jgi:hypothetical protein
MLFNNTSNRVKRSSAMNTGLFILVVLLAVAWWISGEVHRLQANKQEQLDDELALARIVGVLEE